MSSYVIPVFPAASRVPPRDALAARLAELTGRFAELSSELAAIASAVGSVSGKADKAPPSAAGSLAALGADGNLVDSGKSPSDFAPASHASDGSVHHTASEIGQIAAEKVAAVVANAPENLDTLKEIADILGSAQQSGTVLKRISDLESGKADSSSLAAVATSGSYGDLSGRPAVPAVDAALVTSGAAADAKAVGDALRGGFTEWVCVPATYNGKTLHVERENEEWNLYADDQFLDPPTGAPSDATNLTFSVYGVTATRHLVTPTKTSQLTNDSGFLTAHQDISGKLDGAAAYPAWAFDDYEPPAVVSHKGRLWRCQNYTIAEPGAEPQSDWLEVTIEDLKQDALSDAQLAAVNSGVTAEKVATWDGYAEQIVQKANTSDLPYRLVTPGAWEFSDGQSHTLTGPNEDSAGWVYQDSVTLCYSQFFETQEEALVALLLTFTNGIAPAVFTATRASLPGHLLDRAGSRVVVSGDTTLTLPAANPGRVRDLYVRLSVSASGAGSTVTWTVSQGESWDAMGAPPSTFAEGTHLYHITEVAPGVWHCDDMLALVGLEAALAAINGGVAP